jgi:NAD+ diphosphatase
MQKQKYCRFCGEKLISKILSDGAKEKYCKKCDLVFFETPLPCVIVLVVHKNKILLVQDKNSQWGLVAGYVKTGETAEESAKREVREEVNLKISELNFLKTYYYKPKNLLMIAFKAKVGNNSFKIGPELNDAKWFDTSSLLPLPPNVIAAKVIKQVFPKAKFKTPP